jgi:hypothetical protein
MYCIEYTVLYLAVVVCHACVLLSNHSLTTRACLDAHFHMSNESRAGLEASRDLCGEWRRA